MVSGFGILSSSGFIYPSNLSAIHRAQIEAYIQQEELATEIAVAAGVTLAEAVIFCVSSEYSLEFIKAAVLAGARLSEEDIKQTMEERTWKPLSEDRTFGGINLGGALPQKQYTFIITTITNDRIRVRAVDCCLDEGCLIFEDGEGITVMAIAAGHWVKAEKIEDDQDT